MQLPTVKVKNAKAKDGWMTINESDFDPKKHTLYEEAATADVDKMKKDDVRKALDDMGIEHDGRASVDELRDLLKSAMAESE